VGHEGSADVAEKAFDLAAPGYAAAFKILVGDRRIFESDIHRYIPQALSSLAAGGGGAGCKH